jgi:hypothetical protein
MVDKYRPLFYNDAREKKVPEGILFHSNIAIVQAFWDGFYAGDGDKSAGVTSVDQKGKQMCTGLWILAVRVGKTGIRLNCRNDKPNIFRMAMNQKRKFRKSLSQIKKLYEIHPEGTERMVYDLEKADDLHRFHVGPGKMVVHNTDSVFPKLTQKDGKELTIQRAWKMADELAQSCTATLYNAPHNLELEYGTCKIAWFYELNKKTFDKVGIKKRYISWKFMKPDMSSGKLSASGVEIKRRGMYVSVQMVFSESDVARGCVVCAVHRHSVVCLGGQGVGQRQVGGADLSPFGGSSDENQLFVLVYMRIHFALFF